VKTRTQRVSSTLAWVATLALLANTAFAQAPFDPPGALVLNEARSIVQSMIDNPRGPYSRILWFCNDGTTQPPAAYACRDHGGGRQHAGYSPQRERLAELGWSVGTVFAALDPAELANPANRYQRLRELALERYLIDTDDGWVLRQARNYRGRVQVEDEEATGRELLLALYADRDWLAANYLLARESARTIPHIGIADDRARETRRAAIELADLDRSFEPLRAEIHGAPAVSTAARVRAWAENKPANVAERAATLASELDALYGPQGRRERLAARRQALARRAAATATRNAAAPAADAGATASASASASASVTMPTLATLVARLDIAPDLPAAERLTAYAAALRAARALILQPSTSPPRRLDLFDLVNELESEVLLTAAEALADPSLTRGTLVALASRLCDAAYGTGLLTAHEHATLGAQWQQADDTDALALDAYAELVAYLRRVPQWAVGAARYTFAEPLARYAALDPRAGAFVDDLLRSSSLVGLAEVTRRLARDLAALTGVTQTLNEETGVAAFGLNAGIARGPLKIYATQDALDHATLDRADIALLPETVAELAPVAGIVTLGEGNPLSHVQLLARNFGIPNIAIVPELLPLLEPLADREVLAAVGSDGSLALVPMTRVSDDLKALIVPANERGAALTVPRPDLGMRRPLPLAELQASLSGRVVGPKAANLGQLARLFPGRVAPAVAVPFGIFAAHLVDAEPNLREQLVEVYLEHAAGTIDDQQLIEELARIRGAIAALTIDAPTRAALLAAMRAEFGEAGTYGLFVRSDTNVEDLPQFTGAGLSETLPNIVGTEAIFEAIPRVWSSVLSPRAVAWRSSLLTNPDEIYASVLLMQSVPSEKSGVMVTTNLAGGEPGLTVSAAWGVGGAVGGEAAETVVLHPDGRETLVSEAKAAYRRALDPAGGLRWVPAADGRVLTEADKRALAALAAEVARKYTPALDENGRPRPWDIEFGFVADELTLFQIRPLVERGQQLADRVLAAINGASPAAPPGRVALDAAPLTAAVLDGGTADIGPSARRNTP
jgi:hypothetical protein